MKNLKTFDQFVNEGVAARKFPKEFKVNHNIYLQEMPNGKEAWDTHQPREDWGTVESGTKCIFESFDKKYNVGSYRLDPDVDGGNAEFELGNIIQLDIAGTVDITKR